MYVCSACKVRIAPVFQTLCFTNVTSQISTLRGEKETQREEEECKADAWSKITREKNGYWRIWEKMQGEMHEWAGCDDVRRGCLTYPIEFSPPNYWGHLLLSSTTSLVRNGTQIRALQISLCTLLTPFWFFLEITAREWITYMQQIYLGTKITCWLEILVAILNTLKAYRELLY